MEKWMNMDRGREGVKNSGNFADVLCTWPLRTVSGGLGSQPTHCASSMLTAQNPVAPTLLPVPIASVDSNCEKT